MRDLPNATGHVLRAALLAVAVPLAATAAEPQPLSAAAARELMAHARGPLLLDDVLALDVEGAEILAAHDAGIALDKVTALSVPTAAVLALHGRQRPAAADDPRQRPDAVGNLLARLRDMLATEPPDGDAARDLIDRFAAPVAGSRRTAWLSLKGLERIDPELAVAVAIHAGPLALDGIRSLSVESARALSLHTGELSLTGLEHVPADVRRALARHRGPIALADAVYRSGSPVPAVHEQPR